MPSDDLDWVGSGRPWRPREPRRWLPALAAAAAVLLTIGLSVTLAGGPRPSAPGSQGASSHLAQFPPYYVALQQGPCFITCTAGGGGANTPPDRAVVHSTVTGNTLATIPVPKPYATFAFVQGTANDRVFILGAQRISTFNAPPTRLYLLRFNPSAPPGNRAHLSALHVPLLPTGSGYELCWIALSPNGHLLATIHRAPRPPTTSSTQLQAS